jgi:hypothetical protein
MTDPDQPTRDLLREAIRLHQEKHSVLGDKDCREWFFGIAQQVYDEPVPVHRKKTSIPAIPGRLELYIRALVHSANLLRNIICDVREGQAIENVLKAQAEPLKHAEAVINEWGRHLGLHR